MSLVNSLNIYITFYLKKEEKIHPREKKNIYSEKQTNRKEKEGSLSKRLFIFLSSTNPLMD